MTDVHSPEVRSYNMSRIKGKNTKPEILVRKFLFSKGFRFRLHSIKLAGKPDIVLPAYKTVIFVHGCFWHGHDNCKYFIVPKTNTEWWLKKIGRNKQLDAENLVRLMDDKWNVIILFECALKKTNIDSTMDNVLSKLKK